MALAQPVVRLGGPLWDEEVVPALRKRLESESRTLSKRMSAISLVMDDAPTPSYAQPTEVTTRHNAQRPSHVKRGSSSRTTGPSPLQSENSSSGSSTGTSRANPNSARPPASSSGYQRSRTFSQPDTVNIMANGSTKAARNARTADGSKPNDLSKHRQPTRIPKPSRAYGGLSNGNTPVLPQTNVFPTFGQQRHAPETHEGQSRQFTSSSTRSTVGLANNRSTSGLMNEPAPFPASPSTSTLGYDPYLEPEEPMPRRSTDSDERPFEHWYRGEVSRNGGVGELRVGRQQEMLEIANYGHMIREKQRKTGPGWNGHQPPLHQLQYDEDSHRRRRRAGSIGGLTDMERQRGSVLFDEEGMAAVGRVLDEHPLTDLESEGSDIGSLASRRYRVEPDYIAGVGDVSISTVTPTMTSPAMSDDIGMGERSVTPTPHLRSSEPRNGEYPPSRIPSRQPRMSSDSRSATPTMYATPTMNGSYSHSKTPSPPLVSTTSTNRSVSGQSITQNSAGGKRGGAPPAAKRRTPVKSLRGKQSPPSLAKKADTSKDSERTVSQYPVPASEEDMSHAIPTWTQPVPKTGNWDEVVLPVVARQKGLDEFYQTADGSPQPRKVDTTPAPAPGTFGYDATKYRRRGDNDYAIEMDEFGRPAERQEQIEDREEQPPNNDEFRPYDELYSSPHDETRLPVRPKPPPSPAPFAQYAPQRPAPMRAQGPSTTQQQHQEYQQQPPEPIPDLEDKGAGCCKCTIM